MKRWGSCRCGFGSELCRTTKKLKIWMVVDLLFSVSWGWLWFFYHVNQFSRVFKKTRGISGAFWWECEVRIWSCDKMLISTKRQNRKLNGTAPTVSQSNLELCNTRKQEIRFFPSFVIKKIPLIEPSIWPGIAFPDKITQCLVLRLIATTQWVPDTNSVPRWFPVPRRTPFGTKS